MTRADTEIAIEDFGRSRMAGALNRLFRKHGVGILKDEYADQMLAMLRADEREDERIRAANLASVIEINRKNEAAT